MEELGSNWAKESRAGQFIKNGTEHDGGGGGKGLDARA